MVFKSWKFAAKARLSGLRQNVRRFHADEDGAIILLALLMFAAMIVIAGFAVDTIRFESKRVELQNTLDRAVLAAADLDQSVDATAVVVDYFEKAGLSEYLDKDSIDVQTSMASGTLSYRRVTANAKAEVPTFWLDNVGVDSLQTLTTSSAEEGITDLEISLVVDVSGSMGNSSSTGYSKIYELREAAKDFVYYMQCNPEAQRGSGVPCSVEEGKVSISLIPYAEQVYAGKELLDYMHVTNEHDYSHCLNFDSTDYDTTTVPQANDPGPPDALLRTGHFDPWSYNTTYADDRDRTCRTNDWRKIRPLVKDYQEMIDYIDDLGASGNTSIDVGMKWGAALLDPSMRNTVGDLISHVDGNNQPDPQVDATFVERPYNYDQDYNMKVIVLMTDGVNTDQHYLKDGYRSGLSPIYRNTHHSDRYSIYKESTGKYYYPYNDSWNDYPYGDADGPVTVTNTYCRRSWWYGRYCWTETETVYQQQPGAAVQMTYQEVWEKFTTDWFSDWSWLDNPVNEHKNGTKNQRLQQICDAVKSQDSPVVVYSIGFEVSGDAVNVMKNCATSDGMYFSASGSDLADKFGLIASSINQLRLTQ